MELQECAYVQIERDERERCRFGEGKSDRQQGKRPEGPKRRLRGGCEMRKEGVPISTKNDIKGLGSVIRLQIAASIPLPGEGVDAQKSAKTYRCDTRCP